MELKAVVVPLAENDVLVVNEHGRRIALFYREFDSRGGREATWGRAVAFISAVAEADDAS